MSIIYGTSSDDFLRGTSADDTVFGAGGDDTLLGQAGDDYLSGDDGQDLLQGGVGDDTLLGGTGDDYLRGGAGIDFYDGGDGRDRVSFFDADATQGVYVDLEAHIAGDGFGNLERLVSIEDIGSGTQFTDWFYGDDGSNLILAGRDYIYGRAGADSFQLEEAPYVVDGGAGIDTILSFISQRLADLDGDGRAEWEYTDHGVTVDLGNGVIIDGFNQSGRVAGIENVGGSAYDDVLIGDGNTNELAGLGGTDELVGGGGLDLFTTVGGIAGVQFVHDFEDGVDRIVFRGMKWDFGFKNLNIEAHGDDVVITWGDEQSAIILVHTSLEDISASDFLFFHSPFGVAEPLNGNFVG